jgi:hypothetical protein
MDDATEVRQAYHRQLDAMVAGDIHILDEAIAAAVRVDPRTPSKDMR